MTSKTGGEEGGGGGGGGVGGCEGYDDLLKQCYESARLHQKTLPDNAELELFTHRSNEREVSVLKRPGEALGLALIESGWGSMLPTVVVAAMATNGPAQRCHRLNIGDQIIAVNGKSLVGLSLGACTCLLKACRRQSVATLTTVSCPPVVSVTLPLPSGGVTNDWGCTIDDGVIFSITRGGLADLGGLRVGHRLISIDAVSVVRMTHDQVVDMLTTSRNDTIHLKTMPYPIYRLLTGQELPSFI